MTVTDPSLYSRFVAEPDSTHNLVVSLVPPGSRVLELGCATGYMSEVLKNRLGCTVIGVELSAEAGALAEPYCERVIIGDVEMLDIDTLFAGEQFNCIIVADVLEHLREPEVMLRRLAPFLASDGAIVGSIPNIAHGSVRLSLLEGEFRYRDTGLLDRTHIRFFTRASVQDLFASTGYAITHLLRKRTDIMQTEIPISPEDVPTELWDHLADDLEATTYQFVIRAVPAERASAPIVTDATALTDQPARSIMKTLTDHERNLKERDAWIANLQDQVVQKDERIVVLQHDLEEWRAWIDQLQRDTAIRDERIASLEREQDERLAWIEQLKAGTEARDTRIANLEEVDGGRLAWIEQLKATIEGLEQEIAPRDERIANLEAEDTQRLAWIEALKAEIADLTASIVARDERFQHLADEHETWRGWIQQLHGEIQQLQADVSQLRGKIAKRDQIIARMKKEIGPVDRLIAAVRRRMTRGKT